MLPSKGYFKDIICPYDKANLCLRPYCHFKHVETDDNCLNLVETEYLSDVNSPAALHHSNLSTYHDVSSSYVPSYGKGIQPAGILKTSNSIPSSAIPVYNPTPISKLKELNSSNSHFDNTATYSPKYTPEYSYPSKKNKKIEEYDPTEVKVVSKRCVTFVDQSDIALDEGYAPAFSSSEEETDNSENVPKFSDDDENDCVILDHPRTSVDNKKLSKGKVEEDEIDEKKIDEFSIVDKILVDSKKNEKLLANFQKPVSTLKQSLSKKQPEKTIKSKSKTPKVTKVETKNDAQAGGNKHLSSSNKEKVRTSVNSVYDCDADRNASAPFEADIFDSSANSDESKKNKVIDPAKKLKISDSAKDSLSKEKHKVSDKTNKNSSNKSKSKDVSKESSKKEESKIKHDKHVEKGSKTNKTEKHKSDKASNKDNKSEKNKPVPSKNEKSSTDKSSKQEKGKSSSKESKEVKLQDEKVTSSSIVKKSKHDHVTKHSSKSSDLTQKNKDKTVNKDEDTKSKTSKRKLEETNSEKQISKNKSSSSKKQRTDDDSDNDDNTMDVSDDVISLSSDSDSDVTEECWKIFNETYPEFKQDPLTPDKESLPAEAKAAFRDITAMQKKRLAHAGAANIKPVVKKLSMRQPMNPGQVMLDRFTKIREAQKRAEELRAENEQKAKHANLNSPGRFPEKKRISAVTNHSLLAAIAKKNRLNQSSTISDFSPLPSTVSKTLKVTKRVAHVPDAVKKPRPVIPMDYGSKVPTVVRQKFLNAFIDEYIKFSATEEEAFESALEEEKKAYQRSSSKAIYMNVASNALNRLRHRKDENASDKKGDGVSSTTNAKTVSHEAMLNGPMSQRASFSIERKKAQPVADLKGVALYEHLLSYVLTEDQLRENGFPLPHPTELGRAVIEGVYASKTQFCNDPFKRTCCRCQKTYYVNVDGDYVRDEECDFHWGRLWKRRVAGNLESRYTCCQGDSESDGCCVGTGHVFEGSETHALKGFVKTLPKTPPADKYYGIYALDCEMCYTTAGVELTRVSVIDPDLKTVYETFVKPHNKVLDYNTRFSGITEDNLKNVRTTIRDVQAVLLCMFNDKTILIGHSLESDLKALKIFHKTVVDTSVVFPHKMGLPFKRALRTLTVEKLNKIIQNDVGGHDSCEDAVSCMELMLWKVKEDLKGSR
ncbi:RNA exonuclease 1 homolog [Argiope bruennichi]|uniref:RNA exonuclease 1 like protein n=1 Tax=Argiope bruennichi TaxID=94029 RepID=A0A8T0E8V9_ARGBR|nr:RNA exonuclease 1 homolog [Argiope bruennichi]KAF8768269.1 RNA exonuclease 1 like protein [Argiope bruennichi]